jgi:hypothetical protein
MTKSPIFSCIGSPVELFLKKFSNSFQWLFEDIIAQRIITPYSVVSFKIILNRLIQEYRPFTPGTCVKELQGWANDGYHYTSQFYLYFDHCTEV